MRVELTERNATDSLGSLITLDVIPMRVCKRELDTSSFRKVGLIRTPVIVRHERRVGPDEAAWIDVIGETDPAHITRRQIVIVLFALEETRVDETLLVNVANARKMAAVLPARTKQAIFQQEAGDGSGVEGCTYLQWSSAVCHDLISALAPL